MEAYPARFGVDEDDEGYTLQIELPLDHGITITVHKNGDPISVNCPNFRCG